MADKNKPWLDDPIVDPKDQPWLNDPIVDQSNNLSSEVKPQNTPTLSDRGVDTRYAIPDSMFPQPDLVTQKKPFDPDKNAVRDSNWVPPAEQPLETKKVYGGRSGPISQVLDTPENARRATSNEIRDEHPNSQINMRKEAYATPDGAMKDPGVDMYDTGSKEENAATYQRYTNKKDPNAGSNLFGSDTYNGVVVPEPNRIGNGALNIGGKIKAGIQSGTFEAIKGLSATLDLLSKGTSAGAVGDIDVMINENGGYPNGVEPPKSPSLLKLADENIGNAPYSQKSLDQFIITGTSMIPGIIASAIIPQSSTANVGKVIAENYGVLGKITSNALKLFDKVTLFAKENAGAAISADRHTETPLSNMVFGDVPEDEGEAEKFITNKLKILGDAAGAALIGKAVTIAGKNVSQAVAIPAAFVKEVFYPTGGGDNLNKTVVKLLMTAMQIKDEKAQYMAIQQIVRDNRDVVMALPDEAFKTVGLDPVALKRTVSSAIATEGTNKVFPGQTIEQNAMGVERNVMQQGIVPQTHLLQQQPTNTINSLTDQGFENFGGTKAIDSSAKAASDSAQQKFMAPVIAKNKADDNVTKATEELKTFIEKDPTYGPLAQKVLKETGNGILVNSPLRNKADRVVEALMNGFKKIKTTSRENYQAVRDLQLPIGRKPLDDFLKDKAGPRSVEIGVNLPSDILELVSKPNADFNTLFSEVVPMISRKLQNEFDKPGSISADQKSALIALKQHIVSDQVDYLKNIAKIGSAKKKVLIRAMDYYRDNVVPLEEGSTPLSKAFLATEETMATGRNVEAETYRAVSKTKQAMEDLDINEPLNDHFVNYMNKYSTDSQKKSVVDYHILKTLTNLVKSGKDLKDMTPEFLMKELGDSAPNLNKLDPKQVKSVAKLFQDIKSKNLTIEELEAQAKDIGDKVKGIQDEVKNSALGNFIEGMSVVDGKFSGTRVTDGYKHVKELFDEGNINKIKELVTAVNESGDEMAKDGLRAAYLKNFQEKLFTAGTENVSVSKGASLLDPATGKSFWETAHELWPDSPQSVDLIKGMAEFTVAEEKKRKGAISRSGITEDTVGRGVLSGVRTITNFVFGPLNHKATIANTAIRIGLIQRTGMKQRTSQAIDRLLSDPEEFDRVLQLVIKDFDKSPALVNKGAVFENLVKIGIMTGDDKSDFNKMWDGRSPKSNLKVPDAVKLVKPNEVVRMGNIDVLKRPQVKNADGTTSTVRSISFENSKGQTVVIPTVIVDKEHPNGYVASDEEAKKHYGETGEHLGIFKSRDAAERYAKNLHVMQEKYYKIK